jgi:hypothetical protein
LESAWKFESTARAFLPEEKGECMRGRKEKTLARNGQRDGWQHLFYIVGGRSIAYVKKDLTGLIPSLGTRRC